MSDPVSTPARINIGHIATMAVVRLRELCGEEEIGTAAGFFWRTKTHLTLVTCHHVVTGRDNDTGKCLHSTFAQPTRIAFRWLKRAQNTELLTVERFAVPLYRRDGTPRWLEHPGLGSSVDVVALPFEQSEATATVVALNDCQFDDFGPQIADDAFVLGFPMGRGGLGDLPIWKRASIATEPEHDFDQRPMLLVDTATSKGMSGGPVLCRTGGRLWRARSAPPLLPGETFDPHAYFGQGEAFLGVYSGRYGDALTALQLARVWKASLLDDVCRGVTPTYNPDLHAPEEIIARDVKDDPT